MPVKLVEPSVWRAIALDFNCRSAMCRHGYAIAEKRGQPLPSRSVARLGGFSHCSAEARVISYRSTKHGRPALGSSIRMVAGVATGLLAKQ